MNLFTVAAAVCYVLAGLSAKGWLLNPNTPNALLFIAAGLLFALAAGTTYATRFAVKRTA